MSAFWVLLRVRLLDVLRSKSSTGFVLLFPIVLFVVLAFVFMNGHPFEQRYVAVVDPGGESASISRVMEVLSKFEEVRAGRERREAEALGKLRAKMASAVIIKDESGDTFTLRVGERDKIFGRGLAQVLPSISRVDVVAAPRFGYVFYLFPGVVVFSVLTSGLFGMGYPMALYRQNLFLKKLATTPLSKGVFIAANVAARSSLILVQVLLLLLVARFVFGMPLGLVESAWVMAISALGVIVFLGVGFLLATVVKNAELFVDVIGAINIPLVFFSEIFFPLDALPPKLATIGAALPSTEMVRLIRAVVLYGVTDAPSLLPGLGAMALWAAGTFAVSLVCFKWHA